MTGPTISLTVPFSLDITEESEPQKADVPRVVPLPDCGGIPGFQSRKRPAEMIIESQPKKSFVVPDLPPLLTIALPVTPTCQTLTKVPRRPCDPKTEPRLEELPEDFESEPASEGRPCAPKTEPLVEELPENFEIRTYRMAPQNPPPEVHDRHQFLEPLLEHDSFCKVEVFRHGSDMSTSSQTIRVKKGSSVGELHYAEDQLGSFSLHSKVCDSVGAFVSDTCIIESDLALHFHLLQDEKYPPKCPLFLEDGILEVNHSDCQTLPRLELLQFQQGWVAKDEMDFYLEKYIDSTSVKAFPSFSLPTVWDSVDADSFIQWLIEGIKAGPGFQFAASTLLWKNHWIPLVFVHAGIGFSVHTSPEGQSVIEALLSNASMSSPVNLILVRPVVNVFPADCGFQCIGWIRAITASESNEGTWTFSPVSSSDACHWRNTFRTYLLSSPEGQKLVHPSLFQVGGAHDEIENGLVELLEKHGVPSDASATRASQVVEKLGRTMVSKILRSQNAWKDLKSCANNLVPKLQLVLTSEMEASIKARANSSTPFGDRQNKKQSKGKKPNSSFFKLRAEDVVIPDCIFKEGSDVAIKQIGLNEIGPNARGIVVVNASQAYPYVKVQQPLSQCGLALLILEHSDPAFSGLGETIRFPAKCDATGEPMIISARLVQLGSAVVSRHFPIQQLKVEESANLVLRVLTFRDEWESDWNSFCIHPVKSILAELPDLQDTPGKDSRILDVFDRQWLSLRMERSKPADSELFVVSFRLLDFTSKDFLALSGRKGLYFEPRTEDGRAPCTLYHVVWLGKIDKPQALIKQQTTKVWTSLVRNGLRFGLRTIKSDAELLHNIHKPTVPFLEAGQSSLYIVGPFPYGASRGAISKIFQSWQWSARPMQPKGRAANQLGMLWECQATAPPEFEIYQLEHADVLITPAVKKKNSPFQSTDVVASARTIAALQETPSSEMVDKVFVNDPWASYQPQKHQKVSSHSESTKFEALAATVEKRVNQALAAHSLTFSGDEPMPAAQDAKVSELESRLEALEATVNKNHQEQKAQHNQVNCQLGKVQQQVESQASMMQNHFDQKMQEQLHQIEALLSKRARSHE